MDYRTQAPGVLRDFLTYHETIQGHSKKTVDEYFLDLRAFFRYLKLEKGLVPRTADWDQIPIDDVDLELVSSVQLTDVYGFMNFLSRDRGLGAPARARKISAIRSFYKYLTVKAKLLRENPMQDLDSPRLKKALPRYLDLDESIQLLDSVEGARSVTTVS
jgi:site-specific recombinase XerD